MIKAPKIDAGLDIQGSKIGLPKVDINVPKIGEGIDIKGPKIGGPSLDMDQKSDYLKLMLI
jgi:hypothetical protein